MRSGKRLLVALCVVSLAWPALCAAQHATQWPSEQEEKLKQIDRQVLDLQKQRFKLLFQENKDEKAIERLNEQFREVQKKRAELLRATGRM